MFACSASCMILTGLVSFRLHCWLNFLMPLRQLMVACTLHFSESESDTSSAAPPPDPKARRTAELRAFLAEIGEAVEKDDDVSVAPGPLAGMRVDPPRARGGRRSDPLPAPR